MRSVGLITEYNPFHNGHLHHLRESLKLADAEVSVAVMSGHFLQRGEPALVDKWQRTEMALAAGVDLVIELPLPWACSSAPDFARGAIQALNALGGIDALCFGSESGDLATLQRWSEILLDQAAAIETRTAELLRQGINYPQGRAQILSQLLAGEAKDFAAPNTILGLEYLKALQMSGSTIHPLTISRIGAGYHQSEIGAGNIASATGIRQRLRGGQSVAKLMPPEVWAVLKDALAKKRDWDPERCCTLLLGQILRDPQQLKGLWLVDGGIENRLWQSAQRSSSLEQLISAVKSRQLTRTRLQRLLMAVLLGISKTEAQCLLAGGPAYLHLLGVSARGERWLAQTRKQRHLPLLQNFSRVQALLKRFYADDPPQLELAQRQLNLQLCASRIYSLLMKQPSATPRQRDYFEPLRRC